jgi:hypothetical protein
VGRLIFGVLALMALSGAAGFYIPRMLQGSAQTELYLPLPDGKPSRPFAQTFEYGCKSIVDATAQETIFEPKSAIAKSGPGPDSAGISISQDRKTIKILFAYDLSNGVTEGQTLRVTSLTDTYLVANSAEGLNIFSLILNLKTLKAVYSFTGQGMLGIKGWSSLMMCR